MMKPQIVLLSLLLVVGCCWQDLAAQPIKQNSHPTKHEPARNNSSPKPNDAKAAPAPRIKITHSHTVSTVDPAILVAWQAYRSGKFEAAWQGYSEVLRKDKQSRNPPSRDALLGMAAIAQRRSQDTIAVHYYRQMLALDPRDPYAHAGMTSLLANNGASTSESRLKLLLAQNPQIAALYFALGNLYAQQSRWGEAQQAYFTACGVQPDNTRYAFNLAVSLDHLGQAKLAAAHYRNALKLDNTGNASFSHVQTKMRIDELDNH